MKRICKMFHSKRAEGYVDTGVKILIAVVIGALLLGGLYALFSKTIMPTVTDKVTDMFNYSASAQAGGGSGGGVSYTMLEADATAVETKTAHYRSDAPISKFASVTVDGVTVPEENYTLTEGSTIVDLKESYIATLEAGTHTLRIVSSDGYAETTFEKKNMISFTISDTGTYQVAEGTTWGEWIASYGISAGDNGIVWICYNGMGGNCTAEDVGRLCVDWGNGLGINQLRYNGNYVMHTDVIQPVTYNVSGPC